MTEDFSGTGDVSEAAESGNTMNIVDRHLVERRAVALVQSLTVTDLHWLFGEQPVSDLVSMHTLKLPSTAEQQVVFLRYRLKRRQLLSRIVADGFVYRSDPEHFNFDLELEGFPPSPVNARRPKAHRSRAGH